MYFIMVFDTCDQQLKTSSSQKDMGVRKSGKTLHMVTSCSQEMFGYLAVDWLTHTN